LLIISKFIFTNYNKKIYKKLYLFFRELKNNEGNNDIDQLFEISPTVTKISRKQAHDLKNDFKKRLKYINMNL